MFVDLRGLYVFYLIIIVVLFLNFWQSLFQSFMFWIYNSFSFSALLAAVGKIVVSCSVAELMLFFSLFSPYLVHRNVSNMFWTRVHWTTASYWAGLSLLQKVWCASRLADLFKLITT